MHMKGNIYFIQFLYSRFRYLMSMSCDRPFDWFIFSSLMIYNNKFSVIRNSTPYQFQRSVTKCIKAFDGRFVHEMRLQTHNKRDYTFCCETQNFCRTWKSFTIHWTFRDCVLKCFNQIKIDIIEVNVHYKIAILRVNVLTGPCNTASSLYNVQYNFCINHPIVLPFD